MLPDLRPVHSLTIYCHRFGEDTVEKMVDWCCNNIPPSRSPSVLEIGSGNGVLLTALVERGYEPELLLGIDYSIGAIELAQKVAFARGEMSSQITYRNCDFLNDNVPKLGPFDLVLDKGTFDAIALSVKDADGSSPRDLYPIRIAEALSPGGHFLLTCSSIDFAFYLSLILSQPAILLRKNLSTSSQTPSFV
jgi:EEF1A lysine methyltransferase 2